MKSSNIGGQAVLEGIMMKNKDTYAVAVRKPDKEIEIDIQTYKSVIPWEKCTKIPFIRGTFNFVDSLVLGMKTLMFSASFYEEEEEKVKQMTAEELEKHNKKEERLMTFTMILSLIIALHLNFVEAEDLLSRAGFAFSPVDTIDTIYQFCIENNIYDFRIIDELVYEQTELSNPYTAETSY